MARTARRRRPGPMHPALPLALAAALLAARPAAAAEGAPPPALRPVLDEILSRKGLDGARVGVCVVSLETGATLYARDADVLLNPASNVKLFTSAAALSRLGPEHRFETEISVDAQSAGSGAVRTLYLRGKGDPTLVTERLFALAADLAHLGLRRVGDLVLDDGFFDAERIGPGFDQEDGDKAYLAPTGALSLNFNTVAVHVAPGDRAGAPGRVELEPDSAFFEVVNHTTTTGPRTARRLVVSSAALPGGRQRILVEGRLPLGGRTTAVWRKIDDPPRYLGETLRRLLEARGVRVTGRVRTGPVPPDARLLHVAESEPLGDVVRTLNKTSNNFVAEQLVKALGAASAGPPGSWASGIAAVQAFLAEAGLPRGAYVMKNGSGLNDANRFSARQTVQLLAAMWRRFPVAAEYLASLPVAGRDGTIRWRMEGTEAAGHVRAKTGTLDGVTALSGYAETSARERLAFAILVNDYAGRAAGVVPAVDAVATALAARGKAAAGGASSAGSGAGSGSGSGSGSEAEIGAIVRTYLALGRAGDRRNVAFLRTALRTETEPTVRLAVAEAIYRSDPDGDAPRRALLDAAAPALDPAALAPLLAGAEPADAAPVLAALADLAADGSAEALARLVELAPAATATPPVSAALAAVLADLADAIPDELRRAVEGQPPPVRNAVAALVGEKLPGLASPAA
ncbi:MAG TPA: D-alanyl-D-alanine carboxypeptidase/D-alanyl-D-alanine-endopeptidase, partial [Anaeromyxobacteraceae bacterium]|nr:D-alanyl-D-alanine carboxypeptidase/D-alanyl-D-alanine-endopeptidase [Anaeromyxobacteraceae bacterium]